jgi:glycosyltransferase involved in cell wall biosynthesis
MNPREQHRKAALNALVDDVAIQEFKAAHGSVALPPVAIVIAAYKEVDNIGRVMATIPSALCGLAAKAIVVIDGEEDGTAEIVRQAGQYAVIAPVNRGQGAALRLGYRVARDFGAEYIVTSDADGQSDAADLAVVLQPIVKGEADFVNGSRRLGRTESTDAVRNLGVLVYATIISTLAGTPVTDTANPMRAMRAELTERLVLDEPQYQASELLLSAIFAGVRFTERPVTMRARAAGKSKKGGNLAYGYRYGRVVALTYLRERRAGHRPLRSPTKPA